MSSAPVPRGVEYAGAVSGKGVDQSGDKAPAAATHRRHPHDRLGPAVFHPAATHRGDQFVEVGRGRRLFAGELAGRDPVATVAQGDDLAFQVPRGEPLRHVLGQRTAVQPHAVQRDGTAIATVGRRREEIELAAALAPQGDDLRQAIGGGVVRFVEEQGVARKVVRQPFRRQSVEGRVRAGEGVFLGAAVTEVGTQPACGIELLAVAGAEDQPLRNLDVRHRDSLAGGERDEPVIGVDESVFDLLLRCRDHGMREPLAEMHRHQGDDLHRFAGPGGLLDKNVSFGSAHARDQAGLVRTKCFAGHGVQGGSSGPVEFEYCTAHPHTLEGEAQKA